jgi:hypothetical protein
MAASRRRLFCALSSIFCFSLLYVITSAQLKLYRSQIYQPFFLLLSFLSYAGHFDRAVSWFMWLRTKVLSSSLLSLSLSLSLSHSFIRPSVYMSARLSTFARAYAPYPLIVSATAVSPPSHSQLFCLTYLAPAPQFALLSSPCFFLFLQRLEFFFCSLVRHLEQKMAFVCCNFLMM